MKRHGSLSSFAIAVFLSLFLANTPPAQAETFGLGLFLGVPLGFTGKFLIDEDSAVQSTIGWTGGRADFTGDYLRNFSQTLKADKLELQPYFGIGARLRTTDTPRFGMRVPVGLSTYFDSKSRFEGFAELAPVLDFAPSLTMDLNGGIGARVYFN